MEGKASERRVDLYLQLPADKKKSNLVHELMAVSGVTEVALDNPDA